MNCGFLVAGYNYKNYYYCVIFTHTYCIILGDFFNKKLTTTYQVLLLLLRKLKYF